MWRESTPITGVSASSLVELKATLLQREEEYRRYKESGSRMRFSEPVQKRRALGPVDAVAGGAANEGVAERMRRDEEEVERERHRRSHEGVQERLRQKAAEYEEMERMAMADAADGEEEEEFWDPLREERDSLVDFRRKRLWSDVAAQEEGDALDARTAEWKALFDVDFDAMERADDFVLPSQGPPVPHPTSGRDDTPSSEADALEWSRRTRSARAKRLAQKLQDDLAEEARLHLLQQAIQRREMIEQMMKKS